MKKLRAYMLDMLAAPVETAEWVQPLSLEWMPAGEHEIYASSPTGDEGPFKVVCDENDASRLDMQLQEMLRKAASGEASRPFIDFDHTGTNAAAIPVRFFWQDGIRLAVEWTHDGSEALKGRTYSYFSPEFYLGDDGHPSALPDVGPIGALVNTPAFQSIERLAASRKKTEAEASQPARNTMKETMKVLVEAKLLTSSELSDEAAALSLKASLASQAETLAAKDEQINALTSERDALAKEKDANALAVATSAVEAAVSAGRLKDDKALREKWIAALHKDPGAKVLLDAIEPVKAAKGHPTSDLPKKGADGSDLKGIARVEAAFRAGRN